MIYQTEFALSGEVNDYYKARAYLLADHMEDYLPESLEKVTKVEWVLESLDSGVINAYTDKKLSKKELKELSRWVRGQNSDGLGEGFSGQGFAEGEETVLFSWTSDPYVFKLKNS